MPSFSVKSRASTFGPRSTRVGLMLGMVILFFAQTIRAQTAAHAWRDHLTRQDVVTALGEPASDASVGNNELLMYKGGLVIQIQNGEVADISGTVPEALKPVAAAAVPAASATTAPEALVKSTVNIVATPAASAPVAASAPAAASASATLADDQSSEKLIGDLSSPSIVPQGTSLSGVLAKALGPGQGPDAGTAPGSPAIPSGLEKLVGGGSDDGSPWSRPDNIEGFLAGLLLKTVVMTLVLKGVFAYKDFPLIWMDAVLVAAGTSLCNELLAWLFTLNDFGKIAAMVQADQLVAGAVLLGLITKCTEAKSFPTAAGIMVVAITVNTALQFAQMFI